MYEGEEDREEYEHPEPKVCPSSPANARGKDEALSGEPPSFLITLHDSHARNSYRSDPALISSLVALHRAFFFSLAM